MPYLYLLTIFTALKCSPFSMWINRYGGEAQMRFPAAMTAPSTVGPIMSSPAPGKYAAATQPNDRSIFRLSQSFLMRQKKQMTWWNQEKHLSFQRPHQASYLLLWPHHLHQCILGRPPSLPCQLVLRWSSLGNTTESASILLASLGKKHVLFVVWEQHLSQRFDGLFDLFPQKYLGRQSCCWEHY